MIDSNENDFVILLTGTIHPNSFDTLVLTDPVVRKQQYIDAILFYLTRTDFSIVFTENSGESLYEYFLDYEHRLECLTYTSLPSCPDKGKGAKELEIIDYAMCNSKFIASSNSIVKITGRLKVLNIKKLSSRFLKLKKKNSMVVSCNPYRTKKMDARCFFFSLDFWPYLKQQGKDISLKYSFESALWESINDYHILSNVIYKKLASPLRISGVSGGFGTSYDSGLLKFILRQIRHFYKKSPF